MQPEIDAIFIDLGNTMRILTKDEQHQANARRLIAQLVGCSTSPQALCDLIDERYKAYRKWAFQHCIEAPEEELWSRWLLPDYPAQMVMTNAVELTYQYRQSMGRRVLQEDALDVIAELHNRGYKLGIISNLISSKEIPEWLEADGLDRYFQSVVLSSLYRVRKPDPEIYWEAARRIGSPPAKCAYVGDNLARDVVGTRQSGFAMVIILISRESLEKESPTQENTPDLFIHAFKQLLDVFPAK
jgi:putative hydrolase of the HAD superfamily